MNAYALNLLKAAVSGALAAFVVDVHAWSQSEGSYDWKLAVKRWVYGAVAGVGAAVAVGAVQ